MKAIGAGVVLFFGLLLVGCASSPVPEAQAKHEYWWQRRSPARDLKSIGQPTPLTGKRIIARQTIIVDKDMSLLNMVVIQAGAVMHGAALVNLIDNDVAVPGTSFCMFDLVTGLSPGETLISKGQEFTLVDADSSGAMGYVYSLLPSDKMISFGCYKMSRAAKSEVNEKAIQKEIDGLFEIR